jgi:guanylate kinase
VSRLILIVGPSGVGKGTLIRGLRERLPELELSVSATTRPPRPGELDGVDYHFLDEAEFERRVAAGEFLEHANYLDHRYGTLRSEIDGRLRAGVPVLLEIDVQGARQVREAMPGALPILVLPPSLDALRARLVARGTDRRDVIERRIAAAERELLARPEFPHVLVNDRLQEATDELVAIVGSGLRDANLYVRPDTTEPENSRTP